MALTLNTREKLQEMFCVFCDTDTNHSLKLSAAKVLIHNSLSHLKPIPHFILMLSSILESPRLNKKLVFP